LQIRVGRFDSGPRLQKHAQLASAVVHFFALAKLARSKNKDQVLADESEHEVWAVAAQGSEIALFGTDKQVARNRGTQLQKPWPVFGDRCRLGFALKKSLHRKMQALAGGVGHAITSCQ
jgi:hypothetical protein